MKDETRTPAGEALTEMMLHLFQLNSLILTAGDRLVSPLGLTSARWQILGAIIAAEHPIPVAWIARNLGGNRQNVQRIVNDLKKEGLVSFEPNPHHKRAQLVLLTSKGNEAYKAAMELQSPWINRISDGLKAKDIKAMHNIVNTLRKNLEDE